MAAGDFLISEFLANPLQGSGLTETDTNYEYVELVATRAIPAGSTYSVIWTKNGTATSDGWKAGLGISYGFQFTTTSTIAAGTVAYVGGKDMAPRTNGGTVLRFHDNAGFDNGDGGVVGTSDDGLGNKVASFDTTGVLGNGGSDADGIAVFDRPLFGSTPGTFVDSSTPPIDAIFFGTTRGGAVSPTNPTTTGYQLPVNDLYGGGKYVGTSFLAPISPANGEVIVATGSYSPGSNTYPMARTWAVAPASQSTTGVVLVDVNGGSPAATIADGDTTPSVVDDTLYASTAVGSSLTHTFTIKNSGNVAFVPTNPASSNANFVISYFPASVPAGGTVTFDVTFTPTSNSSSLTSTISFRTNNPDVSVYNFDVTGSTIVTPTITGSPATKVYDGNAISVTASATGSPFATDSTASRFTYEYYAGANLSGGTIPAPTNVGDYSVKIGYSGDGAYGHYSPVLSTTFNFSITPKALTATGTAANKTYDGAATATTSVSLSGVLAADLLNVSGSVTGAFVDKNAGNGKTVNLTGYTLSGSAAGNYSVTGNPTTTANIAKLAIGATSGAFDKVYDGNTNSAVSITLMGTIGGDDVQGAATGQFADKHVGVDKTVTIPAVTLVGTDKDNYSIGGAPDAIATITAKPITVTAAASTKQYDGTTTSPNNPTISPSLASGDNASGLSQAFSNALVGTGKTLTPAGVIIDGNNGNNYAVTFVSANTGTITARVAAPTLGAVDINSGATFLNPAQRSQIVSLLVNFSHPVQLDANAFTLEKSGLTSASAPVTQISSSQISYTPGQAQSFLLTFSVSLGAEPNGTDIGGIIKRPGTVSGVDARDNSLSDGTYKLIIDASRVHNLDSGVDDGQILSGDNQFGENYADGFFRMFGDSDGDGDVDGTDTLAFRRAQVFYDASLDWDGGGVVKVGTLDSTNFNTNSSKKRRLF